MYESVLVNSKKWLSLDNLLNEAWKDIKDYEGLYQVSNYGRVKSLLIIKNIKGSNQFANYQCKKITKKEKILEPRNSKQGYLRVNLYKNSKIKCCNVHRLVAETFIPNPDNKLQVNHINGIKTDNRVENLEWCTASENKKHSYNVLKEKHYTQKVLQYDLSGNFIREYESQKEAKEKNNIYSTSGLIGLCCKNKRKSAYGYIWRYKEEGKMNAKEVLEKYIDKDGKEFVILTNDKGISEVRYVRDLIIETFGNADEYDKLMEEK